MPLIDYQTLVDKLVRDDASRIESSDRDDAIGLAVEQYSKDRPDDKVEDVVSAGGRYLDYPAAWQADFSEMQSLEHPIGEFPPSFINPADWTVYASPGAEQLLLRIELDANATVRTTYSIRRVLTDSADTIPVGDREPVACYAAAVLCEQLATFYSGDSDSTLEADSVNQSSKAREFSSRAKGLRKRYFDALGIDPKRNVAAGVVVDHDGVNSLGQDRLQHPGRLR